MAFTREQAKTFVREARSHNGFRPKGYDEIWTTFIGPVMRVNVLKAYALGVVLAQDEEHFDKATGKIQDIQNLVDMMLEEANLDADGDFLPVKK